MPVTKTKQSSATPTILMRDGDCRSIGKVALKNSSTIGFTCNVTPDFQFNPALYVNNGPKHDLFGYIVFTYTFHLWGGKQVEHFAPNPSPK
jgi:hypothetical protein